ncbi:MAG: HAD-IIIC family phosphatase [Acidobacteria bacterium]|nr:HAD-IIIC family phosphatase [Acidobacteriota bacterium]
MSFPFRFAISSTFTAEPLESALRFWAEELRRPNEILFAPYNQLVQTIYDPNGVFAGNQPGVNAVLIRADDLGYEQVEANAREVVRHLREGGSRLARPLLVCECPASPGTDGAFLSNILASGLSGQPGIHLIRASDLLQLYPLDEWYTEKGERLASVPYTEEFFAALGTMIVRTADALLRNPFKVIVLDCDNTLWRGVCGEDGPCGVFLEPGRRAMQEFFARQRDAGMLLAIASKNNDEDVVETFRQNPEMPLQLDMFAVRRVNWTSKPENIRSLAAELNLGLDSFLFIDDDPKECAEVSTMLPNVLTLPLPHEAAAIPHFLAHVWAFDHPVVTADDRRRAESYQQAKGFSQALEQSSSLEQFLEELHLRVDVVPLDAARLARTAQLTQRTNQFNATAIRRRDSEIREMVERGAECWTIDVTDRFAAHGQTGVVIFEATGDTIEVDTFLLSCRVLGRGTEYEIIRRLGAEALRRGCRRIVIRFTPTAKNQVAGEFLASASGAAEPPFVFEAEAAAGLVWKPQRARDFDRRQAAPAGAMLERPDYLHVARSFAHADHILAAIRRGGEAMHNGKLTGTEAKLAQVWTELLGVPSVQPNDNFFDLGGHSLLVVLLQIRVKEVFGIELDVDDIYSGNLTLNGLATRVEIQGSGGLSQDEYEKLAAEIDALTDEEVRQLLANEETVD